MTERVLLTPKCPEPTLFKNYNLTLAEQIELGKILKETSKKGISSHLNRQWPPCFSLFPKKTANFDHVRTTGI
jgi:hypothetical protein